MKTADIDGIDIAYEEVGSGTPLLLLTGLGGVGKAWGGELIDRFANEYTTIVPDHRGTGSSAKPNSGYTIDALAADMAGLVRHLGHGPAHVVGSSTGGAIAQVMALDHPDTVRSIVLTSSWAGPDPYFLNQFAVRKSILSEQGVLAYTRASSLFLFAPSFVSKHPEVVDSWFAKSTAQPGDPDIMEQRIEMIMAHDERGRLGDIDVPTLVIVGDEDICTPPFESSELADSIPGAKLVVMAGGHLIYLEQPDAFAQTVASFLANA
jgi:aminoacrylate hydrolase